MIEMIIQTIAFHMSLISYISIWLFNLLYVEVEDEKT